MAWNNHQIVDGFIVNNQLALAVIHHTSRGIDIYFLNGIILSQRNVFAVNHLQIKQAQKKNRSKNNNDNLDNRITALEKVFTHSRIAPYANLRFLRFENRKRKMSMKTTDIAVLKKVFPKSRKKLRNVAASIKK